MIAGDDISHVPERAGPWSIRQSFAGLLPSLRFLAGAVLVVCGTAVVMGWGADITLLKYGLADHRPMALSHALYLLLFGALLMLSWSSTARTVSWLYLIGLGCGALVWRLVVGAGSEVLLEPAIMMLLFGLRTFLAARAIRVTAAIDGLIFAAALLALVGMIASGAPVSLTGIDGGLSFFGAVACLLVAGVFLVADAEYARINQMRPAAPLVAAGLVILGVIAGRIVWALQSGGGGAFLRPLSGAFEPQNVQGTLLLMALCFVVGALSAFMAGSGAGALRAIIVRFVLRREMDKRSNVIAGIHAGMDRVLGQNDAELKRRFEQLDRDTVQLRDWLMEGDLESAQICSMDIGENVNMIVEYFVAANIDQQTAHSPYCGAGLKLDDLLDQVRATNARAIQMQNTRILTHNTDGEIRGDRATLTHSLNVIFDHALAHAVGPAPLMTIRLLRSETADIIRISCGGARRDVRASSLRDVPLSDDMPHDGGGATGLAFVNRVARWHGGSFWTTTIDNVHTYNLALRPMQLRSGCDDAEDGAWERVEEPA